MSSAVNTFGPFNKTTNVLETFDRIDFTGGKSEANACLAEGLATALVCFQDLDQIRENGSGSNKFCILICHSAPYQMPVIECLQYENKTSEQLAVVFQENNINLSIISPRKIPVFFKLFEKAGGDSTATAKNYAKDVRHLVLLKGFALSERSPSPSTATNVVPSNIPMTTNQSMDTPMQQNSVAPTSVPPNLCQAEGQISSQVSNQQQQQQQMLNAQMAQMRAQQQQQQQQQNPQMMRPMMNPQGPAVGQMTQQQAMLAQQQQAMAAARQQNPRWARPPNAMPGQFIGQGFPGQGQGGGQMINQPGSALQQQLQGNNSQSQQLRMQLLQNQQNVQMQQGNVQVQMSGQPGMNQTGMQGGPQVMQQNPNTMVPNQMGPGSNQMGVPGNTQQQNAGQGQMQPQMPTVMTSVQPGVPQQQNPQQQNPQQARQRIWSGIVEWVEKTNKTDQTKISRQAPFQVTTNVKEGEPEIRADHWPQRLLMQLMPKVMVGSAGGQYLKESKTVVFHPSPCDALESLSRVMGSGMAGCVHFNTAPQCEIIVLILLYSSEKKAFLGFIPKDQTAFVERLRTVIMQNKQTQGGPQQQQQMIQGIGVPQNQMGMQGPGRIPGPSMAGMQQQQQMDPNEQQWQMNQQAMANQQQVQQMQNQGPPQMMPGPGMVNPQQQRMVRPMMPNNPGLRHLLQQQVTCEL